MIVMKEEGFIAKKGQYEQFQITKLTKQKIHTPGSVLMLCKEL